MTDLLGTDVVSYIAIVLVIMGFAAYMTGQAMANGWKSQTELVVYLVLLGFASRFFIFALSDGVLLSLSGYLIDTALLCVIGLFAYRLTRARRIVMQYPWMYERTGLFSWQRRH